MAEVSLCHTHVTRPVSKLSMSAYMKSICQYVEIGSTFKKPERYMLEYVSVSPSLINICVITLCVMTLILEASRLIPC